MYFKIFFKSNVIMYGDITTMEDLSRLDGSYLSQTFHVKKRLSEPELMDYAWPYIEPHIENMRRDTAEIIEV